MSTTNTKAPKAPKITVESLAALRLQLEQGEKQLAEAAAQKAAEQTAKLTTYLSGIPSAVARVMGRESVTVGEVINFMRRHEAGTLGSLVGVKTVTVGTNHGMHAKRLTPEEETQVKAFFIERAVCEATKQPLTGHVISTFCDKLGISGQTYDVRRKRYNADDAVKTEIAQKVAAFAATPAPAAPAAATA